MSLLFPVSRLYRHHEPLWLCRIRRRVRDAYWWVRHRIDPRCRFHVIRIPTLTPGYYDPDIRILHACMGELCTFVEKGAPQIVWTEDDVARRVRAEMQVIYDWWKEEWPRREEMLPEIPEGWKEAGSEDRLHWAQEYGKIEELWLKKEAEMLKRIVDILPHLWYV